MMLQLGSRISTFCFICLLLSLTAHSWAGNVSEKSVQVQSTDHESAPFVLTSQTNDKLYWSYLRGMARSYAMSNSPEDLFPKTVEPVRSRLVVFTVSERPMRIVVMYDGTTVKRVMPPSARRPEWALVKTENHIIIPAWTHLARTMKRTYTFGRSRVEHKETPRWGDITQEINAAQTLQEKQQIQERHNEECWARLPLRLKKQLTKEHHGNIESAKLSAPTAYRKFSDERLSVQRASYFNQRLGHYAGLDMHRYYYISFDVDPEGNVVISKNHAKLEELNKSPASYKYKVAFLRSWDDPAECVWS